MMVVQLEKSKRIFYEEFNHENDSLIIKKENIVKELKNVFDPEIPVNIYDLGLIYEININDDGDVKIKMTLTSPNCPVAESLPLEVADKIKNLNGLNSLSVFLTFEPPWDKDMMSEDAKLALDIN